MVLEPFDLQTIVPGSIILGSWPHLGQWNICVILSIEPVDGLSSRESEVVLLQVISRRHSVTDRKRVVATWGGSVCKPLHGGASVMQDWDCEMVLKPYDLQTIEPGTILYRSWPCLNLWSIYAILSIESGDNRVSRYSEVLVLQVDARSGLAIDRWRTHITWGDFGEVPSVVVPQ